MPLSDIKARKAKPKAKQYKLFDNEGLFLMITPQEGNGGVSNIVLRVRKNCCHLALTPK